MMWQEVTLQRGETSMTLTLTLYDAFIQAFANMIGQSALIVTIVLGFRYLGKEIKKLGPQVPKWIVQWEDAKNRQRVIDNANMRRTQ